MEVRALGVKIMFQFQIFYFQLSGIVTQGRGEVEEWVRSYMISYSLDALKWEFARDIYGNKKASRQIYRSRCGRGAA